MEDIVKVEATIISDPPAGESKQPGAEDIWLKTPDGALEPPENLELLAELSTTSAVRSACVEAIARNTVGLGYEIRPQEGHEREIDDITQKARDVRDMLEALAARDKRLGSPTFTDLMMAVKTDEEEVGNGYLEVSRNKVNGVIDGLFHVPGKRVRRKDDYSGYLLLPPDGDATKATHFVNFGDRMEYEPDGELIQAAPAGSANELLPFRLYTSESRDYGLPRDRGLMLEYLGDKKAGEANISFFNSSGTPPTVVFVQGDETRDGNQINVRVPANTANAIVQTLQAGQDNRRRVAVIPLPAGVKPEKVELGVVSDRDIGFTTYREGVARRTIGAFRLQPIFVPVIEDTGRYTAEVQRAITKEQLFDGEQDRYEKRLQVTILRDLGYGHLKLIFKDLAVEDDAAKRDSADKMADVGTITHKEHREAHGYAPLPESTTPEPTADGTEPEIGKVPKGWNDELIEPGGTAPEAPPPDETAVEGTDQRGLKPGIAGRNQKRTENGTRVNSPVKVT